jgi:hypothetical protein
MTGAPLFLFGLVIGLMVGTTIGVLVMAALTSASRRPPEP